MTDVLPETAGAAGMRDGHMHDTRDGTYSRALARCEAWSNGHPRTLILAVGLFGLLGCMGVAAALGQRPPVVHDEWSYLLAADTFAHGRLTNPPHPMWQHFETLHVLHQPTYMSKYPPLQGAVLALGEIVAGDAHVGVWLSVALMGMALCWMLMAWAPSLWAAAGALLGVTCYGIASTWGTTLWGGAVAATGGALLFGAARRLADHPRPRDGVWLGVGLVVLALSRPYEGLVAAVPAGIILLVALARSRGGARRSRLAAMGIAVLLGLSGLAFQAYYNYRGTGRALELPYMAHVRQYESAPHFVWQPFPPMKTYRHDAIGSFWSANRDDVAAARDAGLARHALKTTRTFYLFFAARAFHIPAVLFIIGACLGWRDKWVWIALGSLAWMLAGNCASVYYLAHYSAPLLGVLLAVCTIGLWKAARWLVRALDRCSRGRLEAHRTAAGLAAAGAFLALGVVAVLVLWQPVGRRLEHARRAPPVGSIARREEMRERIVEMSAGPALVLVRYLPGHSRDDAEWVYNGADIDGSDVAWARDMGPEENARLVEYYQKSGRSRTAWLLEVADVETAPRLTRYSAGAP